MAGAPKPRMITTSKGRLINAEMVKLRNRKIELKKAQGENTNRRVKENLRKVTKTEISNRLRLTENRVELKRKLLEKGIDARQLKAKGFSVIETSRIFGLQETAKAFGTKRFVSEFGGLEKVVLAFDIKNTISAFGGVKRIVGEFGLEEAYRAFGITTINKAFGGSKNIIKILGPEEVIRAAQAAGAGIQNYDVLKDIREYSQNNGVVETARLFGVKYTGRALGLGTGDMTELARRLQKKK